LSIFLMIVLLGLAQIGNANAAEMHHNQFQIHIIAPEQITTYPDKDVYIKLNIKNNTDKNLGHVFTYITMANLSKMWTVNLEDYGADQPTIIGAMKPYEEKVVELPIKLVYPADYYLYATVLSKDSNIITSSNAIPVTVLGNTKLVPLQVQAVSVAIPSILLLTLFVMIIRRRYIGIY